MDDLWPEALGVPAALLVGVPPDGEVPPELVKKNRRPLLSGALLIEKSFMKRIHSWHITKKTA